MKIGQVAFRLLPLVLIMFMAGCSGDKGTYEGGAGPSGGPVAAPTLQPPIGDTSTNPDADGDGIVDASDSCPDTAAGTVVGSDGCAPPAVTERPPVVGGMGPATLPEIEGVIRGEGVTTQPAFSTMVQPEHAFVPEGITWDGLKIFKDDVGDYMDLMSSISIMEDMTRYNVAGIFLGGELKKIDTSRTPAVAWSNPMWLKTYPLDGSIKKLALTGLNWEGYSGAITGVVVDNISSDIYLTGWRYKIGAPKREMFLLNYDKTFALKWQAYISNDSREAASYALLTFKDSVYVLGAASFDVDTSSMGDKGIFLAQFSKDTGAMIKAPQFSALADLMPTAFAIDPYGQFFFITAYKNYIDRWGTIDAVGSYLVKVFNDSFSYSVVPISPATGYNLPNAVQMVGYKDVFVLLTTDSELAATARGYGSGGQDIAILKFDKDLNRKAGVQLGTPKKDKAYALSYDRTGHLYAGACMSIEGSDYAGYPMVYKYKPDDLAVVSNHPVETGGRPACVKGIAFDRYNEAYVAGDIVTTGGNINIFIQRYNNNFEAY